MIDPTAPAALVLAGAAALGAYQVGVVSHVVVEVARDLGRPIHFDILSGTSAGAINVAAMASGADDPVGAVARLAAVWTGLRLDEMLRPSGRELVAMLADLAGAPASWARPLRVRGGLIDPRPVERLCAAAIDPERIAAHLRSERLRGVAVAATHVATGRAAVFHQARVPARRLDGAAMNAVRLGAAHVMASAAVPLLFPAVTVDGDLYCDGGLRQLVPVSPALRLGARRVLMVSSVATPAPSPARTPSPAAAAARRAAVGSPMYLAGKALDALFADGVEADLDRLVQINRLLEAGRRRFGPGFAAELDGGLAALGAPPVRPIEIVHVRPSRDLAAVAAAYVAGPAFARRSRGAVARVFRYLVGGDPTRFGGLLAYLLFDGGFAAELIALGRADARAQHAALVELLDPRTGERATPRAAHG